MSSSKLLRLGISISAAEAAVAAAFSTLKANDAEPELVDALKASQAELAMLQLDLAREKCLLRLVECTSGEAAAISLDQLVASGVAPDARCFRAALRACADTADGVGDRGEWAALLFDEALEAGLADAWLAALALRATARSSQWQLAGGVLAAAEEADCVPPALDLEGALLCCATAADSASPEAAPAGQLAMAVGRLLSQPSVFERYWRCLGAHKAAAGSEGGEGGEGVLRELVLVVPGAPWMPIAALTALLRAAVLGRVLPEQLGAGPTGSVLGAPLDVWFVWPAALDAVHDEPDAKREDDAPQGESEGNEHDDEEGNEVEEEEKEEVYEPSWSAWRAAWRESAGRHRSRPLSPAEVAAEARRRGGVETPSDVASSIAPSMPPSNAAAGLRLLAEAEVAMLSLAGAEAAAEEAAAEAAAEVAAEVAAAAEAAAQRWRIDTAAAPDASGAASAVKRAARAAAARRQLLAELRTAPGAARGAALGAAPGTVSASGGPTVAPLRCSVLRLEQAWVEDWVRDECLAAWYDDAATAEARRKAEAKRQTAEAAAREAAAAAADASVAALRTKRQDRWVHLPISPHLSVFLHTHKSHTSSGRWAKVNERFAREREAERLGKRGSLAVALDSMVEKMVAAQGLTVSDDGERLVRADDGTRMATAAAAAEAAADTRTATPAAPAKGTRRPSSAGARTAPSIAPITTPQRQLTSRQNGRPRDAPPPPPSSAADEDVVAVKGVGPARAAKLRAAGRDTVGALAQLSEADAHEISKAHGLPLKSLLAAVVEAKRLLS